MKYLKYFQQDSEYTQFKNSSDYILPNVSYVVADDFVNYNAYVIEKIIMQVGNQYPEIVERLRSMVNKYLPSSISNTINDMINDPEAPEYIKGWKTESQLYSNAEINVEYDQNTGSDNYVLRFSFDVLFYDPSIDLNNIDWEDPSIEGKIFEVSGVEVSQLLSSEDIDFIKSISVDGMEEGPLLTHIGLNSNQYDEGVFNELDYINLYWACSWNCRYSLSSYNNYELSIEASPN